MAMISLVAWATAATPLLPSRVVISPLILAPFRKSADADHAGRHRNVHAKYIQGWDGRDGQRGGAPIRLSSQASARRTGPTSAYRGGTSARLDDRSHRPRLEQLAYHA